METAEVCAKIEEFQIKNHGWLKMRALEDSAQEVYLKLIEKAKDLKFLTNSFISQRITWQSRNEYRERSKYFSLEDGFESEDGNLTFEDILEGTGEKEISVMMANIDIEQFLEEMEQKNPDIRSVIEKKLCGFETQEIAEMTGKSDSTVSKICNMKVNQTRKERRKEIDIVMLPKFVAIIKKYGGKKKKCYWKLKDISLHFNGRITYSIKNYFNGTFAQNHFYISYIDEINVRTFGKICRGIK